MSPFKRCIIFLADGARPDILETQLQKGDLPNMACYLVEPGTFKTILTSFPSTTGPAYMPYLTGCFPGTCNVPGIRWFDKKGYAQGGWSLKNIRSYVGLETFLMNRDMRPHLKTTYDIVENSFSIMNMVHRGVKGSHNKTSHSRIWYYYYAHLTDHWHFVDKSAANKLIDVVKKEDFHFAYMVFPSIDEYSHRSSPFHPRTIQAYGEIDLQIGKIIEALKKKGILEETLMILVSDHGLSETNKHFDIGPYLESKGIKTLFHTQIFKRNFKAASMVSGNGMANLYFKGKKGWGDHLTFEELCQDSLILDELRLRPEIGLVATRGGDGSIHVLTEKGHGSFKMQQDQITYSWNKAEPLGLPINNLAQNSSSLTLTKNESLKLTFNTHYPDVFVQLAQLFSSPRSGDVVISATSGSDLRERYEIPEHKSSHGALCPEHMKIPFLMNYPLNEKNLLTFRSVDVFPTYLELLGYPIPEGIDGRSLL